MYPSENGDFVIHEMVHRMIVVPGIINN